MSHYKPYPTYKDSGVEWLGAVPNHWGVTRLGFVTWVRARLGWKGLKAEEYVDNGFIFLATPNIKGKDIDFENVNFIDEIRFEESPEIQIRVGDVLLAKDGSTLGTVNVVKSLPSPATVNSSIAVITPDGTVNSVYLYYLFRSSYIENTIQILKGGMGVPHLFQADLNKFSIPLPPLTEQQEIVADIDRETNRIDALVSKKTRFIELLREKRQALITQTVTKGLDPTAKMKDSGVEWLGDVPEHWRALRIKQVAEFITSGPRGWSDILAENGEDIFLQSGDLNDSLQILPLKAKRINAPKGAEGARTKLQNNDVVVCITGANTGRVAYVESLPATTYINQHLCLIRLNPNRLISKFLALFLSSRVGRSYFDVTQYGLKEGLSLSDIADAPLALPPVDEQRQIVITIEHEITRFDELTRKTERSIELLKERRSALITAAVTGQIDLREAA